MIAFPLLGRTGPPSFAEPWHAQAFAAVVALSHAECFTWTEWVSAFAAEIARAPQRQGEEGEAAYYRQWLAALERLLSERSLMTAEEIGTTAEDWRRSYLHTPHGKPVNLRRNLPDIAMPEGDDHPHHQERTKPAAPVTIDPA